jgi:hypothetical protein
MPCGVVANEKDLAYVGRSDGERTSLCFLLLQDLADQGGARGSGIRQESRCRRDGDQISSREFPEGICRIPERGQERDSKDV